MSMQPRALYDYVAPRSAQPFKLAMLARRWFSGHCLSAVCVAVALFCPFNFASAANLILNPGFETGDFTAWTQSGWFIDSLNPNSGVYDASTGCGGSSCTTPGDPNSAYVFQDLVTAAGTTYDLSFFYDSGQIPTFASELLVLWGDPNSPSLSTVLDLVDTDTSGAYVEFSGTVTATSATSQLEFFGRQDLDFYYLDDISLTASTATSTVPEPRSLSLILTGMLGALFIAGTQQLRGKSAEHLDGKTNEIR